jgi:hypothetical protein
MAFQLETPFKRAFRALRQWDNSNLSYPSIATLIVRGMSFAAASSAPDHTPDAVVAAMLAMLRAMASLFVERFGAPAALIKGGAIYGKTRARILRWLHDMECVLRRLLLLRAALFPAPAPRAIRVRVQGAARRRKEGDAEALFGPSDDPAQWRVAFRMPAPPEPLWMSGGFRATEDAYELGHRVEHAPEDGAAAHLADIGYWADDPRPLAERFEALLRVIQDSDHYAARLAQRLHGWRGRLERRQIFLHGLCAAAPIANEAGLSDAEWSAFAEARTMARALIAVFGDALSGAPAPNLCDSP